LVTGLWPTVRTASATFFDQHNHPESFEISIIARHNVTAASRKKTIPAIAFWHLDVSYVENPSDAIFFIQRNFEAKAIK
jgi:hypothetical protein